MYSDSFIIRLIYKAFSLLYWRISTKHIIDYTSKFLLSHVLFFSLPLFILNFKILIHQNDYFGNGNFETYLLFSIVWKSLHPILDSSLIFLSLTSLVLLITAIHHHNERETGFILASLVTYPFIGLNVVSRLICILTMLVHNISYFIVIIFFTIVLNMIAQMLIIGKYIQNSNTNDFPIINCCFPSLPRKYLKFVW